MQKLHFSTFINAPRQRVWRTMLDDASYREWTRVFNEGSYYVGSWEQGSEIRFIGPDRETGEEGGMYSRVKENRQYEFISIEHLGIIKNGVVDTTSEEVKKWTPAFENYTSATRTEARKSRSIWMSTTTTKRCSRRSGPKPDKPQGIG